MALKPYYERDGVTIYHGDCREVEGLSAHVVLTDPPYGIRKAGWDDAFPAWAFELCATLAPVLGIMPGIWNLPECPRSVGRLQYKWTLAAYLANGMTRSTIGFGNWIPCLVYDSADLSAYKQDGDCRRVTVGREAKPEHPSPKPLEAVVWFLSRLPGTSVIDPFMGSGTTLLAAKALHRQAIGIELEERYCEIAAKRLDQGVLRF